MKTTNASTALALIFGLGLGVASLPAAATQHMLDYDTDSDGMVDAEEASAYAEQEYGDITADEDLTEERFGTMYQGTGDSAEAFAEIDEDGDGEISAEEWVRWREQGFAEATGDTEGEMAGPDFEEWRGADITGTRTPAERSPSGGAGGSGSSD